jgi:hypothetical protein
MVEESQNGGRVSSDACLVGSRKERKYPATRNTKRKATSVKRNGQTIVARWIKLSSPSRHVEDVALQMPAGVLISATAAVDFGV